MSIGGAEVCASYYKVFLRLGNVVVHFLILQHKGNVIVARTLSFQDITFVIVGDATGSNAVGVTSCPVAGNKVI